MVTIVPTCTAVMAPGHQISIIRIVSYGVVFLARHSGDELLLWQKMLADMYFPIQYCGLGPAV